MTTRDRSSGRARSGPAASPAPGRCVSSGGCRGRVSFVPPNGFRQGPFWPARVRADAAIPGQVVDVHGKQNGAIYQEVTLGRSDIATVSLLAEARADVLQCRINGKHGDHSSHLHPRHTARDARPVMGFGPHCGPALLPHEGSITARDHDPQLLAAAQRLLHRLRDRLTECGPDDARRTRIAPPADEMIGNPGRGAQPSAGLAGSRRRRASSRCRAPFVLLPGP